jgi:hypothetical protein
MTVVACKRCSATGTLPLPSLGRPKSMPCPYCKGVGLVKAGEGE